jgi:hypothetical protein
MPLINSNQQNFVMEIPLMKQVKTLVHARFFVAKLNGLSKEETLACFGAFYRNDVLQNPEGTDHQNIRNFIEFGWDGIEFEGQALQ